MINKADTLRVAAGRQQKAESDRDMKAPSSLGPVIRAARRDARRTLKQVAEEAALSISFLSQIERNLLTPSISALKRIADVLDIPAGALMFGADSQVAERLSPDPSGAFAGASYFRGRTSHEMLTPDLRRRMSMFWLNAPPRSESGPSFTHDGEDAVVVLKGRLRVEIGGVWHELGKGDSLYFNSELPHRWMNATARPAEVIWVSNPPSF